jgi:4-oxalocrotonate tautomerase
MPIVTIQQSPRSIELKRELVRRITTAFGEAYGIAPDTVQIYIHEVDGENWAVAGALASERAAPTTATQ